MVGNRIVVGAVGDGSDEQRLHQVARQLRDAAHEVVFVGGRQTAEQLARTAVAEDAARLVLDADDAQLTEVAGACVDVGADDIVIDHWCDAIDALTPRNSR